MNETGVDLAVVGGGLHGSLAALAFKRRHPQARVAVVEHGATLGGNHLWCFHARDVPSSSWDLVAPLVVAEWPAYRVRFPGLDVEVRAPYRAVTSGRLHQVVTRELRDDHVLLDTRATAVTARGVECADGRVLRAPLVVDARGPGHFRERAVGYQKFLGLELAVEPGTAPALPVLMDATVEQVDGFRFMYVIPLAPDRVLVEDTRYADGPALDREALRREVMAYASRAGLRVVSTLREETGVLPLPGGLPRDAAAEAPVAAGYAGAWFHPTTGYSLGIAVRVAEDLAERRSDVSPSLRSAHRRAFAVACLLNRALFTVIPPAHRWRLLRAFHQLPHDVITGFYAMEFTPAALAWLATVAARSAWDSAWTPHGASA